MTVRVVVDASSAIRGLEMYEIRAKEILKKELIASGLIVETDAKRRLTQNGHIISGNLKASIHVEYQGKGGDLSEKPNNELDVVVGSNVVYAHYIEVLDPYLFPSLEAERPELLSSIKAALSQI